VVLGPVGQNEPSRATPSDVDPTPAVCAAAETLVARLERAEKQTRVWSDEPLGVGLVEVALGECLSRLAATGCWGEANRLPSSHLWRIAGPLLETGVLQSWARFKPRGYAGDFEMLARIVHGDCCDHPLGRAFDRFFQNQAAPQAVRARTEQIAAAIASHCLEGDRDVCHVASVGSGPAIDVRRAAALLPRDRRKGLRVTLLDLDPEALEYARRQVEPLIDGERLACVRTNLARLPTQPRASECLEGVDFLVCSGLFDYLGDEAAAAMLGLFRRRLAPGGMLLVGNFAPHNPTRAFMEWIGNWYLTYRTADELKALADRAGIPRDEFAIGCERTGIDLFLAGHRGIGA